MSSLLFSYKSSLCIVCAGVKSAGSLWVNCDLTPATATPAGARRLYKLLGGTQPPAEPGGGQGGAQPRRRAAQHDSVGYCQLWPSGPSTNQVRDLTEFWPIRWEITAAQAVRSRGAELLSMIRLDIVSFDHLDIPPIRWDHTGFWPIRWVIIISQYPYPCTSQERRYW